MIRIGRMPLYLALLLTAALSGCTLRVPRIDPQGRSIFLPQTYTQVQLPRPEGRLNCLPEPAWTPPVDPLPCDDIQTVTPEGVGGGPRVCGPGCGLGCGPQCRFLRRRHHHLSPGEEGTLQLTPRRLVARVGSEVVLRSGVCDKEGRLVTKQPIEWILTQDSTGHLVELGGTGRPLMGKVTGTGPRKVTDRFAVTHTSSRAHLITRGTPTPADDVPIKRGEGWVTVTSPREGVSYVSAIAPKAVAWKKRRDTAIIHWIDAKWELPSPASVRTTQAHELVTRVTSSEGDPREGWRVRYEAETGPSTEFVPGRASVVEVTTDDLGEARVNLEPLTDRAGATRVKIEIIRPGDRFLEEQVVGRGWTTVRWSAPALQVEVLGPSQAEFDRPLRYLLRISNPGDLPARGVVVSTLGVPRALEYLNSMPAPRRELTDSQEWNLGDLEPGQGKTIEANYRVVGQDDAEILYRVAARDQDDTVRAEGEKRTAIFVPSLKLDVLGETEAEVGQHVQYEIRITNTGRSTLTSISIHDTFDPGLRQIEDAKSPIYVDLDKPLAPGASESMGLTFIPTRPGYFCHTVTVTAEGGHRVSQRACLSVRAAPLVPRRQVTLRVSGDQLGYVDSRDTDNLDDNDVLVRGEVINEGNVPLTNVIVEFDADANLLSSKQATVEPKFVKTSDDRIRWTLDSLGAGERRLFEVYYNCQRETRATDVTVLVTADDNVNEIARRSIEIRPERGAVQPRTEPGAAGAEQQGLRVSLFDLNDPVPVNGVTDITIQIENNRNQVDGKVQLYVSIPVGLELVEVLGSPSAQQRFDQGVLTFRPVETLRANERLSSYRIRLRATQAGDKMIKAQVVSDLERDGIEVSEQLTVTPN